MIHQYIDMYINKKKSNILLRKISAFFYYHLKDIIEEIYVFHSSPNLKNFLSVIHKIILNLFNIFIYLLLNFSKYYLLSMFFFLFDKENKFFSDTTKENQIQGIQALGIKQNNSDEEKNRFIVILLYSFKYIKSLILETRIDLGSEIHTSSTYINVTKVSDRLKLSYFIYFFLFFLVSFNINILSSAISFMISWYFLFTPYFSYYENIIYAMNFIPIITIMTFFTISGQNLINNINNFFSCNEKQKMLSNSKLFFFFVIFLFMFFLHSKSDVWFLSKMKEKSYYKEVIYSNGIDRIRSLFIMKNTIIEHKISSFRMTLFMSSIILTLKPLTFKSLNIFPEFFHNFDCSCKTYNPFILSTKISLSLFLIDITNKVFINFFTFILFVDDTKYKKVKKDNNTLFNYLMYTFICLKIFLFLKRSFIFLNI